MVDLQSSLWDGMGRHVSVLKSKTHPAINLIVINA